MAAKSSRSRFLVGGSALAMVGLFALTSCGGGGASPEEAARLKKKGAERVHKEERLRKLEKEVKHLKKKEPVATAAAPTSAESSPEEPSVPSLQACDQNISANSATSCSFAENVFVAYWEDYEAYGEQSSTYIVAYSPTTEEDYGMTCAFDGSTVSCSGGTEAFVTFPMWAVRVY